MPCDVGQTYLQQFPKPLPAHVVAFPHSPLGETINVPVGSGGVVELVLVVVVDTDVDVDVDVDEDVDDEEVEDVVGDGVEVGVDVVVGSAGWSPQRP
jgi:hypothetical protein